MSNYRTIGDRIGKWSDAVQVARELGCSTRPVRDSKTWVQIETPSGGRLNMPDIDRKLHKKEKDKILIWFKWVGLIAIIGFACKIAYMAYIVPLV
jgi:hypothetical protein